METDWAGLHKMLSDATRRSILELLAERGPLAYTDVMTILRITNTGRLNYHLKVLGTLLSKDEEGRYLLTDRGRQAAALLKAFPERAPPEQRLTALKVVTAAVLVLVGVILVASFVGVLSAAPLTASTTETSRGSSGLRIIPANTTVLMMGLGPSGGSYSVSWGASGPVTVYVLNQTQSDALVLAHTQGTSAAPFVSNFTGTPGAWVDSYAEASGNVTVALPAGSHYVYVWSRARAIVDGLTYTFTQGPTTSEASGIPPAAVAYGVAFIGLGVALAALGVAVVTHRVWR